MTAPTSNGRRPWPERSRLNEGYLDGLEAGVLRLQRCGSCGTYRFPPSTVCATCLSPAWDWSDVSGRGVVWSWIRMHKRYLPGLDELPYLVCLIELAERPRMISTVTGLRPGQLRCDLPVVATFAAMPNGTVLLEFSPAEDRHE